MRREGRGIGEGKNALLSSVLSARSGDMKNIEFVEVFLAF